MTKYLGELFSAGINIRTIKGLNESMVRTTCSVNVEKVGSSNSFIDLDRMVQRNGTSDSYELVWV